MFFYLIPKASSSPFSISLVKACTIIAIINIGSRINTWSMLPYPVWKTGASTPMPMRHIAVSFRTTKPRMGVCLDSSRKQM